MSTAPVRRCTVGSAGRADAVPPSASDGVEHGELERVSWSTARSTDARVPAREASCEVSCGVGVARSGRAASRRRARSSDQPRSWSARVRGVDILTTILTGLAPLPRDRHPTGVPVAQSVVESTWTTVSPGTALTRGSPSGRGTRCPSTRPRRRAPRSRPSRSRSRRRRPGGSCGPGPQERRGGDAGDDRAVAAAVLGVEHHRLRGERPVVGEPVTVRRGRRGASAVQVDRSAAAERPWAASFSRSASDSPPHETSDVDSTAATRRVSARGPSVTGAPSGGPPWRWRAPGRTSRTASCRRSAGRSWRRRRGRRGSGR